MNREWAVARLRAGHRVRHEGWSPGEHLRMNWDGTVRDENGRLFRSDAWAAEPLEGWGGAL